MPSSPVHKNLKIEALRTALDRVDAMDVPDYLPRAVGVSGADWEAVVDAARALVVEYDEQMAYVQFLMDTPLNPEDIRRLMVTTDPETVERVASTVAQPVGVAKGTLDP